MNITPDRKSLLSNRLNDASPKRIVVCGFGLETVEPPQPPDNHNYDVLPKSELHRRMRMRLRWRGQSADRCRHSTPYGGRDQRALVGATKSAGLDSATQNSACVVNLQGAL
jgi:hypothetical protein